MNNELIKKILDAAIRAPSGDNVQPWRFEVSENFTRIDLYNLPEKDDSYYNYQQAASYIAHGAVLENILIAARHLGANAEYKIFPSASEPDLVAQINLTTSNPQSDPLYSEIFNRCTNRFPYQRIEVTKKAIAKLKDSVKNVDNVKISLVYQKDKINAMAKILMVNDRLVFERKDIHGFLFDKIRWNKKQVEETNDGMPVETLGLNSIEKLFFPLMRFWWFVKTGNYLGLSRIIGLKCWWNCRNASMLGMISVQGNDKFAYVQGGRAMQRLWLETAQRGLVLQPIIGLTLLINRLKHNRLQEFTVKQQKMVIKAAKLLPANFGIANSSTIIMGFRLGKSNISVAKTKRINVSE